MHHPDQHGFGIANTPQDFASRVRLPDRTDLSQQHGQSLIHDISKCGQVRCFQINSRKYRSAFRPLPRQLCQRVVLTAIQQAIDECPAQPCIGIKLIDRVLTNEDAECVGIAESQCDDVVEAVAAHFHPLRERDCFTHQIFAVRFLSSHRFRTDIVFTLVRFRSAVLIAADDRTCDTLSHHNSGIAETRLNEVLIAVT